MIQGCLISCTMDGSPLKCPLCCNDTFTSKESLLEHLSSVSSNLLCPICNIELPIENLMNHLVQNECQEQNTLQESFFQEITGTSVSLDEKIELKEEILPQITDDGANNKLYVELLSKQLMKPCLQTQELKLVKEDGESRYLILTNEDLKAGNDGTTIVTKQNSDGTISMTTIKNLKIESDPALALPEPAPAVPEPEDSQDELLYSCNTCGVSFNSVVDHIRNYHNDQEVVVEEPLDTAEDVNNLLEIDNIEPEEVLGTEKQKRHIITETGDIVEADLFEGDNINNIQDKAEAKEDTQLQTQTQPLPKKEESVKRTRNYTKRYVQIDKFCESVVKDIKEDKSQGPFHKVIVKEVAPIEGGDKIKVYNCMSCNVYVTNLDEFKEYPCKTLKYPCPHCSVSYENAKSLCAHMKVHKGNTDNNLLRHICDVCSTVFQSHKSLKLHKRMHDPVKSRPIEFPVDQGNGDKANNHFICTVCDKLIPMDYLVVHQNSHKTNNKFNCDICNKKFDDDKYLEMHMTVHSTEKTKVNNPDKELPYACVYCSRQFARPHEKVKHERIHTGEKPHSCEICGKSFRVSYCLTLHMRTHTGARPYACPHCQKRFKAHSVYNHHLLTHSDVRAYKCPYCPKAFKTSVQLAGHKNSHTKPFSCQHCNRPFASLYAVRVHTETHSRQNNLKFSCSLCGASYARSFALKDHIKQVHKQELVKVANEDWTNFDSQEEEKSPDTQTLEKNLPIEIDDLEMATTDTESVITGS